MKIAVLLTCHNRKEKTLACLSSFYNCTLPVNHEFEIFLVDDGSTDGTSEEVVEKFPLVKIIQGSGNLYWNQGMRLAWKTAAKTKEYDFYMWLNDDTIINTNALKEILACHDEIIQKDKKPAIIVGTCEETKDSNKFSYGGRTHAGEVIPNGKLQGCTYINGNIVLIPKDIYRTLGNLSNDYTHGIGDNDYGLRAIKAGYKCYTTKKYIATCSTNEKPRWSNPEVPLKTRLALFYAPTGLNYKEYILYRKKFWGVKWISYSIKAYAKVLFPKLYNTIKL